MKTEIHHHFLYVQIAYERMNFVLLCEPCSYAAPRRLDPQNPIAFF